MLRLVVTLDGEDVVDCEPVIGYLHRGMEKIAENRTNVMFVPTSAAWITRRACSTKRSWSTPRAPGQRAGAKRASYIRVLMLELNRIANHLLWLGPFLADVGAQTPFLHLPRAGDDLRPLETATGQRLINNNYFRIGGVAADLPYGWLDKCLDFCDWFGPKVDEYEKLITNNPIFRKRIEGLGTITREQAINWSLSGPMLRASEALDLRKVDHYECYDDFDWDVACEKEGILRPLSRPHRRDAPVEENPAPGLPDDPRRPHREPRASHGRRQGQRICRLRLSDRRQEGGADLQDPQRRLYTRLERARAKSGSSCRATTMDPGASRSARPTATCRSFLTSSRERRWPTS